MDPVPLRICYSIHSYLSFCDSLQVLSDNRLKMENAFRQVGVHNSDYARHVLSKVAPPTNPRKDTTSTIFK